MICGCGTAFTSALNQKIEAIKKGSEGPSEANRGLEGSGCSEEIREGQEAQNAISRVPTLFHLTSNSPVYSPSLSSGEPLWDESQVGCEGFGDVVRMGF